MTLPTPSSLCDRTDRSLENAPNHRRLVLISAGVTALAGLLASALNLLLEQGIGTTGGLGGLGLRSALTTVQSLISILMTVLLPFWAFGYTAVTLKLADGHPVADQDLLHGFRIFRPVLRLILLQELLYMLLALVCMHVGNTLLSFTPLASDVYDLMLPVLLEGGDIASLDPDALSQAMIPMFIGCLVLFAAVAIPVSYRMRMAQFILLDQPQAGARRAIAESFYITKGNVLALVRLDLHFWWFYLLEAVLAVICYGDVLLPLVGIEINGTVAFFLFYVISLALQLALYWQVKNRVSVTYAHAYRALSPAKEEE